MTRVVFGGRLCSDVGAVSADAPACTLRELLLYFLRLGAVGFGGPIALAGYMQRDLVEQRRWVSEADYLEGLALAQLAPGPLAAQLAIYLGWVRAGVLGATMVSLAFVLPSFVMVLALSAAYVRFGGLPWMQGLFYGVGAAVIAVIGRSAVKLTRLTLGTDGLLWTLGAASALITGWTETELLWVFLLSGLVALAVRAPLRFGGSPGVFALAPWGVWILSGAHGAASAGTVWRICWYFAEAGAFVFGSGLAIVPFLYGGVVERFHWLDERQFLDAVAVAMITPGPVVIAVAFIGYLVAGPLGATGAAVSVFLPCYLFVVIPARYFRRAVHNLQVRAFVAGVTAAATGAIAGAAFILGRRALVDWPALGVCLTTVAVLVGVKRLPEPLVIAAAGAAGVAIKSGFG